MRALVARGTQDWMIEEVPDPKIGSPDEVLLEPLYAGLCFTDKHNYEGAPFMIAMTGVQGHEWSGRVIEVGGNVETVKVGDRIAADRGSGSGRPCGECIACRAGHWMICANPNAPRGTGAGAAFAELSLLPESACYLVPDAVTDLQSGFVEPAAVGLRAARFSGVAAGDNVVFLGAEDYTLSAFQWASRIAGHVLVADPSPARREMVESLGGATAIIDPNETDPVAWAADHMPWGADVVFIGTEMYVPRSHQYLSDAILIARPGGTVVISRQQGVEEPQAPLANWVPPTAFTKELKVLGFGTWFGDEPIYGGRLRGDYQRTIDGCAEGKICGPGWKPTVVPFADLKTKADVDEVFSLYPDKAAKVLFKISGN